MPWFSALRRSEALLFVFFLYMSALTVWRTGGLRHPSEVTLLIPLGLVALARADDGSSHSVWSIVRDWLPAGLVLVAYWSVDWAGRSSDGRLEQALIVWDRRLLNDWGLRAGIEHFGAALPSVLDVAYLLLFAVPPLAIAWFYVRHERDPLETFLYPFLLGTLIAYALLPHFPSSAPRLLFPGQDLPGVDTAFRRVNLWILDHWDIRSSLFPSGHVAVGFSAAFAMWRAGPGYRCAAWALLALTMIVWLSTIYGRYHYAADGLAALVVSLAAIGFIRFRDARANSRSIRQ